MHRTLTIADGLVQSQVNAIHEDRGGFLWFGTFGGVSRWDGRAFRNYEPRDGLAGPSVRAIHETRAGALVFATEEGGLSILADGRFRTVGPDEGLPSRSTHAVCRRPDGSVLVAVQEGVAVFPDEGFDPAAMRIILPGIRVRGFSPLPGGEVLLNTFGHGVLVLDGDAERPLLPEGALPNDIVRAVLAAADGTVWISVYRAGVWLWRDGTLAAFPRQADLGGHDVKAFHQARDGTVYMSTLGGGVAASGPDGFRLYDEAAGLPDATSWAVHEVRGGAVFLGTWGGVGILHPGRTLTLDERAGLPDAIVTSIAEMPGGTIALGTINDGVVFWDGRRVTGVLGPDEGLSHGRVWSLLAEPEGSLLIGTNAGLDRWRDGEVVSLHHAPGASSGRVYGLAVGADGRLFLATYGGVLVRDGDAFRPVYAEDDPGRSTVYCVCPTRAGPVVCGTARGLVVIDGDEAVIPDLPGALGDGRVWSVHEDRAGRLHFGTDGAGLLTAPGGLADLARPDRLDTLDVADGLPSSTVHAVGEDAAGRLFLTTRRGLVVVPAPGDSTGLRVVRAGDGLASDECNQGACLVDAAGGVWVGTAGGVTRYDPSRDRPVTRPPQVHLLQVRLWGDDLPRGALGATPTFGHHDNFFRFDYVATNPQAPDKVVYRHRLTGVDRDWVEGRETSVQYTSLPPASYEFAVLARNEWGVWSAPLTVGFRIAPPFWRTWWFVTLAVLAAGGAVALVVTARVRHLLAYERLRTKIAADLHDDIGAGLAELAVVGRVLETRLPPDQRDAVRGELDHLGATARRLTRSMSDIVWLVNPRRDSLRELLTRLADTYGDVFARTGTAFRVEGLEALADLRLGLERRQHLYLMLKEGLNNALKHGRARRIDLTARVEHGRVEITLRDDGCGFDPSRTHGHGLGSMRRRAARLGGELEVATAPGRGTTLLFRQRRKVRGRGLGRRPRRTAVL